MKQSITDTFILQNGVAVPALGYGTWQTPDGSVARDGVAAALRLGYRHVDTAFAYGNEQSVGEGIRLSGVSRSDIFLTTKHWVTERGYEKTKAAIDTSLKNLGVDYLDLYLIHWPCVAKVSPEWKEINASTWRAFEDAYKAGKLRAIGVSNFQKKHLEALAETAEILPMVNQIEFHPGFTQMDNVRYAQEHGMLVEAWSPLGCGAVLGDARLAAIAGKYGKSVAQLCLRFALQNDVLPLSKSVHEDRIASNAQLFDFEIDAGDMAAIAAIEGLGYSGYAPEDAPADALAGE
ncbi:MAG: aldo/keto reductase [Clostridia bacterium]|nr:aldo/keto reductase [Clostridia bacterium]